MTKPKLLGFSRISKSTQKTLNQQNPPAGGPGGGSAVLSKHLAVRGSLSGSQTPRETSVVCHRGEACWACRRGVRPGCIKTSAARGGLGSCPALLSG